MKDSQPEKALQLIDRIIMEAECNNISEMAAYHRIVGVMIMSEEDSEEEANG